MSNHSFEKKKEIYRESSIKMNDNSPNFPNGTKTPSRDGQMSWQKRH